MPILNPFKHAHSPSRRTQVPQAFRRIGVAFLTLTLALTAVLWITTGAHQHASAQNTELPVIKGMLKEETFHLEVALTPQALQQGLMYRTKLSADKGMMFPFTPTRRVDFWMKNCLIPLDMVFLRKGQVVHVVHSAPPCRQDPCPSYPSVHSVDLVLEIPAGTAKRIKLQLGDPFQFLPPTEQAPPSPKRPIIIIPEAVPEQF